MTEKSYHKLSIKQKVSFILPPVSWAIIIFAISAIPSGRIPPLTILSSDKLIHMTVYAILGILAFRAFNGTGSRIQAPWIICLFCVLYGFGDEFHQMFVPGRNPSIFDVAADAIGAIIGIILWWKRKILTGNFFSK
ncbi:MAG: VanZ family protein [Candidatus Electryonea clarkiae]|nr:VanZ family protein [Candidatus Electryonea clarkiae]MDP8288175.1 VanZ family protein [Candidatus Electryonea clarkiae]